MKNKIISLTNKVKSEVGNFFAFIKMKFYEFYLSFCSYVLFYTGYSFEIIINAFTISSLFQILIKLVFSLFSIKLSIILQISLLFVFMPIYLNFNTFDYFRTLLANFFWQFVPENAYNALDPDRDDEFFELADDMHNNWYNHLLLFFIHFFILIRMFLLSEPSLSIILKFMVIRFFVINEYLFLAYTISLVFIFSRFVFLLSDKTLSYWKLSIEEMLENQEESPKITKKNILILTHWSLRDIILWEMFAEKRTENFNAKLDWDARYHVEKLKEKFNLDPSKIQTTPKNGYCIKLVFFISFLLVLFLFRVIMNYN